MDSGQTTLMHMQHKMKMNLKEWIALVMCEDLVYERFSMEQLHVTIEFPKK